MKNIEEFKAYYDKDILPDLTALDEERNRIRKKLNPLIAIGIALLVISLGLIVRFSLSLSWMIIPLMICGVMLFGWYITFYRAFLGKFKELVIQKIIRFIEPGLSYDPEGFIPKQAFLESKIFQARADRYEGDDLVSGRLGKTDIRLSEINVKHIEKTGPKSSSSSDQRKRETTTYPIFRGLFFVADFNKVFNKTTIVLPDTAEKRLGRLGQKLQSMNVTRGQLVKLEDPEFEKLFVVYGDDQVEARYVLSPSLMSRIVGFRRKAGRDIYLSFVASKLYIALSYEGPLFEPSIFKSLIDFSRIQAYFEDLTLAIGLVEDLNLNTRIWNKA